MSARTGWWTAVVVANAVLLAVFLRFGLLAVVLTAFYGFVLAIQIEAWREWRRGAA